MSTAAARGRTTPGHSTERGASGTPARIALR